MYAWVFVGREPEVNEGEIAMVGTFDVANFGDLLFPVLAENALNLRGIGSPLVPFSLRSAKPLVEPTFSSFSVKPIQEFAKSMGDMRGLIVGGGDLIRFDSQVARGYSETECCHFLSVCGYFLLWQPSDAGSPWCGIRLEW